MTNKQISIHQFTPTLALGDSVSKGVLYTQKLLKELGYDSKIYIASTSLEIGFKHDVYHIKEYNQNKNNLLFYHHSIGHNYHDEIMKFLDKKIMIYHNITPPHFFKHNEKLKQLCILGREQLKSSTKFFIASLADSDYNAKELIYYGYKRVTVLPILVEIKDNLNLNKYNKDLVDKYKDIYNIIFVGRIVSNKAQHQLIDIAWVLKKRGLENFKIHIIGGESQTEYMNFLHQYTKNLNLQKEINIAGKVSDEDLQSYYLLADLYLSVSEHEGFGIPFIEATQYDIPVLSYELGSTQMVLPPESAIKTKSPSSIAKKVLEIKNTPQIRYRMILKQREKLKQFSYQTTKQRLEDFLISVGVRAKSKSKDNIKKILPKEKRVIKLEGPFDSSYSLAILNRNLAKALYKNGNTIQLFSTEGFGDFEPDLSNLDEETKTLAQTKPKRVDITIRNLYPPRTNAMRGYHKIMGIYGWEESSFPLDYVDNFNSRLTMVLCMSSYVKKVMIQNGIKTPLFTTGIGADHVLEYGVKKPSFELLGGFRLLHISSCFPRKGVDILLEVFSEIAHFDISLVIKTFPNPHNRVKEQISTLPLHVKEKILLIEEELSSAEINYLYTNCDALVAPSRGEGFGLPMAEAMLFELPVVTTGYGGARDFCFEDNSWLIDYSFARAKTHFELFDSYWVEPSKKSLKEILLYISTLPKEELKQKTKKAKQYILSNYTWELVAKRVEKAIDKYEQKQTPKPKLAWISSYNTKCGIASYSHSLISHFRDEVDSIKIFANKSEDILSQKEEKSLKRVWSDRFAKDIKELNQALKSEDFTHIVIEFNFAFFSMKHLKEIINNNLDKKILIQLHSVEDVTIKGLEASLGEIANTLKKVSLIVHNISALNTLKSFGLVENVTLLPLGVEVPKLEPKELSYTLATFGFLLPHKGTLELIEAFYHLKKSFKDANLLLLNSLYPSPISLEYYKLCRKRIEELNLQDSITFITDYLKKEEIYDYLSRAKLLVLPYKDTQESASASIRDMIVTKRPILATKQNIFNDVLDIMHQTEFKNPKELSNEIEKLLKDESKLYSKSSICQRWIKEHSFEVISKKFFNILL